MCSFSPSVYQGVTTTIGFRILHSAFQWVGSILIGSLYPNGVIADI